MRRGGTGWKEGMMKGFCFCVFVCFVGTLYDMMWACCVLLRTCRFYDDERASERADSDTSERLT